MARMWRMLRMVADHIYAALDTAGEELRELVPRKARGKHFRRANDRYNVPDSCYVKN
jgi:hypothetical protein